MAEDRLLSGCILTPHFSATVAAVLPLSVSFNPLRQAFAILPRGERNAPEGVATPLSLAKAFAISPRGGKTCGVCPPRASESPAAGSLLVSVVPRHIQ